MNSHRHAALLGAALALSFAPAAPCAEGQPAPEVLLKRLEDTWGSLRARMTATMTVRRAGRADVVHELVVLRDGAARTRVDFLSPERDRGKVVIMVGGKVWLYLPRARKAVALSRRQSLVVAGATLDDLSPGQVDDARLTLEDAPDAYTVVIRPEKNRSRPTSRIVFAKTTLLPTRKEDVSPAGRPIRTISIEATRSWKQTPFPARVRFVDQASGGTEVLMEIHEFAELPPDVEALFDPGAKGVGGATARGGDAP